MSQKNVFYAESFRGFLKRKTKENKKAGIGIQPSMLDPGV